MDGNQRIVTCPHGKTRRIWTVRPAADAPPVTPRIRAPFGIQDDLACSLRSPCTTALTNPRRVTFRPHAHHEAIQRARSRQQTQKFTERDAKRAGVEGTMSQGVRIFDRRQRRSIGQAETQLLPVITAPAMHVTRLVARVMGDSSGEPRISRFAALAV